MFLLHFAGRFPFSDWTRDEGAASENMAGRFPLLALAASASVALGRPSPALVPFTNKEEHELSAKFTAECTICGEVNNCCSPGGTWYGSCPDQHSYEEGNTACVEGKLPGYNDGTETVPVVPDADPWQADPLSPCPGHPNIKLRSTSCKEKMERDAKPKKTDAEKIAEKNAKDAEKAAKAAEAAAEQAAEKTEADVVKSHEEAGQGASAYGKEAADSEDLGNGPVRSFSMHLIKECHSCGADWCKTQKSGKPDCVPFTFNDPLHVRGPDLGSGKIGCKHLHSLTPYCVSGANGNAIYAVSKPGSYKLEDCLKPGVPTNCSKKEECPKGAAPLDCLKPLAPELPAGQFPTVHRINQMYEQGRPANDLDKAGLVVHCADGTEEPFQPYTPCNEGQCAQFATWWSGSIINRRLPNSFGGVGIILHPKYNQLLCAYPWDEGTMTAGCRIKQNRYLPNQLEKMMKQTYASAYNEVLIDSKAMVANFSMSIAAFVYGLQGRPETHDDPGWAHWAYAMTLRAFGLEKSKDRPLLLRANMSAGPMNVFTDVSDQVHEYLRMHPLKPPPRNWREKHAFRDAAFKPAEAYQKVRDERSVRDERHELSRRILDAPKAESPTEGEGKVFVVGSPKG